MPRRFLVDTSCIYLDPVSPIEFNLNWTPVGSADDPSTPGASDLDLGCLYITTTDDDDTTSERRGVVQSVGGLFGSRDESPFIELLIDDMSGTHPEGESLLFYRPQQVKFALVFATIYEGLGDFRNVQAELRMRHADVPDALAISLRSPDPGLRWCALLACGLEESSFVIVPQEQYFLSARHADDHYGFGFEWTVGTKLPALAPRGLGDR